jgi:hypothetical protein
MSEYKYSVETMENGRKVVKKTNDFAEYQRWINESMELNEAEKGEPVTGRMLLLD